MKEVNSDGVIIELGIHKSRLREQYTHILYAIEEYEKCFKSALKNLSMMNSNLKSSVRIKTLIESYAKRNGIELDPDRRPQHNE